MGKVVICDECVPRGFAAMLGDRFEVRTVAQLGWAGCTDEAILARMQRIGSPVLVTMDRGLRWAQPRRVGAVGLVLMHARTNQLVDVVELLPGVVSAVGRVRAGQVVVVDQQERRR